MQALLKRMWDGESQQCNGSDADFSMMAYLNTAPIRILPNQSLEWEAILTNNFKPAFDENSFAI